MSIFRLFLALFFIAPATAAAPEASLPDAPKPIKREMVRMPYWALYYEQPGEVVVRMTIDNDGVPVDVATLAEYPSDRDFGKEAVASVEQWRFKPGVPGTYKVTVKFRMVQFQRVKPAEGQAFDRIFSAAPAPDGRPTQPVYPLMAQEMGMEGTVQLLVSIKGGEVDGCGVVESGDVSDVFGDAAYAAAINWRFTNTPNGSYVIDVPFTLARLKAGELRAAPKRSF